VGLRVAISRIGHSPSLALGLWHHRCGRSVARAHLAGFGLGRGTLIRHFFFKKRFLAFASSVLCLPIGVIALALGGLLVPTISLAARLAPSCLLALPGTGLLPPVAASAQIKNDATLGAANLAETIFTGVNKPGCDTSAGDTPV
jgi:hypothetical protein